MSVGMDSELMEKLHGSRFVESACSSDTLSMYSIDRCLWAGRTDFCEAVIAKSPIHGNILFIDKELQSAESDEALYHEHLVHPVLAATANIAEKRVLVVGGGEGATVREVLKWDTSAVKSVDWVDIDGMLVNLCKEHLGWADESVYTNSRVSYSSQDIRVFLMNQTQKYEIIILDLPDPDVDSLLEADGTTESNTEFALYGPRFWEVLYNSLSPGGAIVSHAGPISPGFDEKERRPGLAWIQQAATRFGSFMNSASYHVVIPSFQGEWGFWMSCAPRFDVVLPGGLRVMDNETIRHAFVWQKYWFARF